MNAKITHRAALIFAAISLVGGVAVSKPARNIEEKPIEKQITSAPHGHILTNDNVWSPDGKWLVYDVRSDAEGAVFDGDFIEMVNVDGGEIRRLYGSKNGAHCGVASFDPKHWRVAFILGPENPTTDWQYGSSHRHGVIVETAHPNQEINLDARDLTPPFTPGALRGGSHVHIWDAHGDWVSFTYNDALLGAESVNGSDIDQRNIGVSVPVGPVRVDKGNPRNHDGTFFTILATRSVNQPRPGSDEIGRAFEESWIGKNGYVRADGTRQKHALAFQGEVTTLKGEKISEVFVADLPNDVTKPAPDGPLAGTLTKRPTPPLGTTQRRLTYTENRKFPGIQGPRHWLRSSPDGKQIGFLMRDDNGIAQIWTISPLGDGMRQITRDSWGVASTFTWDARGKNITYIADNSVFVVDAKSGQSQRVTPRATDENAPLTLACVFSPDGKQIAYEKRVNGWNQIFVATVTR